MHSHMPVQTHFLISTVGAMTASVLLTGPLDFSCVIGRILIGLVACTFISCGRFRIFIIGRSFVSPVGAVVGLVGL